MNCESLHCETEATGPSCSRRQRRPGSQVCVSATLCGHLHLTPGLEDWLIGIHLPRLIVGILESSPASWARSIHETANTPEQAHGSDGSSRCTWGCDKADLRQLQHLISLSIRRHIRNLQMHELRWGLAEKADHWRTSPS